MVFYGSGIEITIKKIIIHGLKEMIFFFIFYAIVSACFFISWNDYSFWFGLPIALGILIYGITYFIVHDIFIHQRFKLFKKSQNTYAKALRRAHKIHHKNINKKGGESFGMLSISFKYFK